MSRPSDRIGVLTAVLAASVMLLWSTRSHAATDLSFSTLNFSLCGGQNLAFRQKAGSDLLEVFCGKVPPPGDTTKAVFNLAGCIGPKIKRIPPVVVTVNATGKQRTLPAEYIVTCAQLVPK